MKKLLSLLLVMIMVVALAVPAYAANDEIIITGGNQCLIISKSGRTKFTYAFPNMIKSMIPSSGSNEYIMTFENKTETIKLKAEDN